MAKFTNKRKKVILELSNGKTILQIFKECGFDNDSTYEKNGFKSLNILMLDVANYGCILRLHKQRFICHSCNKKFFATAKIVDEGCFISNKVKYAIALELKNNIPEKDIGDLY